MNSRRLSPSSASELCWTDGKMGLSAAAATTADIRTLDESASKPMFCPESTSAAPKFCSCLCGYFLLHFAWWPKVENAILAGEIVTWVIIFWDVFPAFRRVSVGKKKPQNTSGDPAFGPDACVISIDFLTFMFC